MQKLLVFVRSENSRAAAAAEEECEDGWQHVARRVKVSCAHQTAWVDGEDVLQRLEKFSAMVYRGKVPVVKEEVEKGQVYHTWRETDFASGMSLKAPVLLMENQGVVDVTTQGLAWQVLLYTVHIRRQGYGGGDPCGTVLKKLSRVSLYPR